MTTVLPLPQSVPTIPVAEKPPQERTPTAKIAPPTVQKPYAVQVRATQDERIARDTLAALKTRDHDAFMEKIELPGKGVWHRIFIGRFTSETEARQYVEARGIKAVYPDFIVRQTPEGAPENSVSTTPAKAPQAR